MRDDRKCITISLSTSTWSHYFVGIWEVFILRGGLRTADTDSKV